MQLQLLDAAALFINANRRIRNPKTASHYRLAIRQYCEASLLTNPTIDDLSDDGLVAMEKFLLNTHAIPTVNSQLSRVKAFWKWLAQRGHVKVWPTIPRLQEPEPHRRAWDVAQLHRLLEACRTSEGRIANIPASDWWTMWHLIQWETGERTGGMLSLRWEWLSKDALDVPADARKGKRKGAYYRLSQSLLAELDRFRSPVRELIFPWPMTRASFWNHYTRLLLRAKLPTDRKCKPQKMRRSHLTWWAIGGGDPTTRAKHTSSETTRLYYLDERLIKQPSPDEILPSLNAKTGSAPS